MSERVVDELEVVEVDERESEFVTVATRVVYRLPKVIDEKTTIRQTCQGIVECIVGEFIELIAVSAYIRRAYAVTACD
jgi:hypothetical protein